MIDYETRDAWGPGAWQDEPDRKQWTTRAGFTGLIVRNDLGALCGYVGVAPGHPWHGKDSDTIDASVHGGLTYARSCEDNPIVCHVPEPGQPEHLWWLGFDCAHHGDFVPGLSAFRRDYSGAGMGGTYRGIHYVSAEVERLADQAKEAADG